MRNSTCIIPARGGSKRIPKKNIKIFIDKPIIAYSIENAVKSEIFDDIYVSSDDEEILEVSSTFGAKPLKRDSKLSDDYTSTRDVIVNCIEKLNLNGIICCLYATSPLLDTKTLKSAYDTMDDIGYTFSAVEYDYSPYRSFYIQNNINKMLFPKYFESRSQDLQKIYHDAGQFYFANSNIWKNKENIFEDSKSIILEQMQVQDIDTIYDWQIAEMKYKLLYGDRNK